MQVQLQCQSVIRNGTVRNAAALQYSLQQQTGTEGVDQGGGGGSGQAQLRQHATAANKSACTSLFQPQQKRSYGVVGVGVEGRARGPQAVRLNHYHARAPCRAPYRDPGYVCGCVHACTRIP